jgi:hypothetical protein
MKKMFLMASVLATLFACNSGGKDYKAMAEDMCGCFNKIKDSIPAEAMQFFEKVAVAEKAKTAYEEGLKTLSQENVQKMSSALMSVGNPGSPAKLCLEEMDKKYKTVGGDKKEVTQKMVDALKGNTGCALMVTLMRMELEKGK